MTISRDFLRACRLGVMALLMLALPIAAQAETVTIASGAQVGYEAGPVNASFVVSRDGQDPLTVTIKAPTGTANGPWMGTPDYTVSGMTPITDGSTGYTLSFLQGENNKVVQLLPIDDALIEGRETITIEIETSALYIVGAPNAAQVAIADNDIILSIDTPDPVADEDVTLNGLVGDPNIKRRGVMRAKFEDISGMPVAQLDRNLAVRLSGSAEMTVDYGLKYRICGSSTGTGALSKIGFNTTPASELTTGLGYKIVAHRGGESFIWVNGTGVVAAGGKVRFNSNPSVEYTLPAGFIGSTSGPVLIQISPVLAVGTFLANGTGVTVTAGASSVDVPSMVVSRTYTEGSTSVEVANGSGGIYIGDVFAIGTDQTVLYVALSDVAGSAGTLDFRCYLGGGTTGLDSDVSATTAIETLITPTVVDNAFNVLVPEESTRFELSVEPVADGVVEGQELVNVTLLANEDYAISNPTVAQVAIADRDSTANIQLVANASKPGTTGTFQITLSHAFPTALTIPYIVGGTAVPGDVANLATVPYVDYGSLTPGVTGSVAGPTYVPYTGAYFGSATIPAGQTSTSIQVVPGSGGSVALPTPTLIVTLNSTLDYKLAGSSGSGVNPSATMGIGASLGGVSVIATDPSAIESPSATAATTGAFSVNINRLGATTSAVGINLRISGNATYLSRYSLQIAGTPLSLTAAGAGIFTTTVTIATGTNTTLVTVVPIDNLIADGSQSVVVEALSGQNYTLSSTAAAVISITDDEPVISVVVGCSASKPPTAGNFLVS
jgi:hypothetical protein